MAALKALRAQTAISDQPLLHENAKLLWHSFP
jgi:hypothetical protein